MVICAFQESESGPDGGTVMRVPRHRIMKIFRQTWQISEFGLVNAFLLEGTKYAALIDTGCGIGEIGNVVRSLTPKPILVLLTNGQMDHSGGIDSFPASELYMREEDVPLLGDETQLESFRRAFIRTRVPVRWPGKDHVQQLLNMLPGPLPKGPRKWKPLEDGQMLDLGGRTMKVLHTPGHTRGSTCYLDKKSRVLFAGDTINYQIILPRQPDNNNSLLETYHRTVKHLWKESMWYDCLAIGHDGVAVPKQLIRDYCDLTTALLNGSMVGKYEEVGIRKGEVARYGRAELWYRCDQ